MEETFTLKKCTDKTENAAVTDHETENFKKPLTNIENAKTIENAHLKREKLQPVEFHNRAVIKQYRPGVKKALSETQEQHNAQLEKYFLNDQWIKK